MIYHFFFLTYSCASKHEKKAFHVVKEVSQGSCQTKKPVYELKTPLKEVRTSKISFSVHGGNSLVKDNDPVAGLKTVKGASSKSFRVSSAYSQRQGTSRGSCDDKPHHRMSSKVKRPLLSEHEEKIRKISGSTRKLSRSEKNCNTKTRELVKAKSISHKLLLTEKGRLLKDLCAERLRSEAETSSASSLSKDKASRTETFSNATENASPVKSAPRKSATSESSKQPGWSAEAPPLPNFKIPKMVHRGQKTLITTENAAESSSSESSNRNRQHVNELSKFETVHQPHTRRNGSQILSCDTKNERSSSSSHLPDSSTTVAHPWQDEVINAKFLIYLSN